MKLYDHPDFKKLNKEYQVYSDVFEGDHDTMVSSAYLVPHLLELSNAQGAGSLLARRQQRTEYTNAALDIFERYIGLMFSKAFEYDKETEKLLDSINGWKDIDGEGTSFDEFIKREIFKSRFIYGRVYLLSDAPSVETRTVLEKRQAGKRPYWQVLNPQAIPAWKYYTAGEYKGKLNWLRHNYHYLPEWDNPTTEIKYQSRSKIYAVIDNKYIIQDYELKDGEARLLDTISTDLNIVPIAVVKKGNSYLKQVVPHIRKHLNYDSNVANILHFQGYQDKAVIGDLSDSDKQASGEYVLKFYPPDTRIQTEQPCYPQGLIEERDKAEIAIFKAAFHLNRSASSDSKQVEAAETMTKIKEDLISYIKTELTTLEDLIAEGLSHLAKFEGDDSFSGRVTFNKDITIEAIDEALSVELAYKDDIQKYPTWHKSVLKKRIQGMNLSNSDEIIKEVESTYQPTTAPITTAIKDVITGV